MEQSLAHLTPQALRTLDDDSSWWAKNNNEEDGTTISKEERHTVLALAGIRRWMYGYLRKYAALEEYGPEQIKAALQYYTLPDDLQQALAHERHGKPRTWYEALEHLKAQSTTTIIHNDDDDDDDATTILHKGQLWRRLLNHPLTAYVPVQCQACGHEIPDQATGGDDDVQVGLQELPPTGTERGLRGGWFRGRPRGAVRLQITCRQCHAVSTWYRSADPHVILQPYRWGRLCGEQEDLRLLLAKYVEIPVRLVVPMDWDHVWSEYLDEKDGWQVVDDSARNFAARLDEGIGHWTRVWAIHPNAELCQDVTEDYLRCRPDGRADESSVQSNNMARYRNLVQQARQDNTGESTQAKTVNGYLLWRANFTDADITDAMQQAAVDYGTKQWWELN